MANLNTSKTINTASYAYAAELEDTRKNLKVKCQKLGIDMKDVEKVRIPRVAGSGDDVVVVFLNGVSFYFLRGELYSLPPAIVAILENGKEI